MVASEQVYELHFQRREHGQLTVQLYARGLNGQLRHVDSYESGPFDSDAEVLRFMHRHLAIDISSGLW